MECREGCGACCIAPSISSEIPGMNGGKPSGVRCIHLQDDYKCAIFYHPSRPKVCSSLKPNDEMCGSTQKDAMEYLYKLEKETC